MKNNRKKTIWHFYQKFNCVNRKKIRKKQKRQTNWNWNYFSILRSHIAIKAVLSADTIYRPVASESIAIISFSYGKKVLFFYFCLIDKNKIVLQSCCIKQDNIKSAGKNLLTWPINFFNCFLLQSNICSTWPAVNAISGLSLWDVKFISGTFELNPKIHSSF